MRRKALIIGITGQDGAYLAQHLLARGYEVHGTSRDAELADLGKLRTLDIIRDVRLHSMILSDFRSVMQTILTVGPEEIYNLGGQSSVGLSFQQPVETLQGIVLGTINILEVLRFHGTDARFYNACSSECFGNTSEAGADENTAFHPRSPYAVAKATAYWEVINYREAYGVRASSGILFNHESPLRPARFVTRKIVQGAVQAKRDPSFRLRLGDLSVSRDWGWAPDYVQAMHAIVEHGAQEDFVIATGRSATLESFVKMTFAKLGLDHREFVVHDPELVRPTEIRFSRGNPRKAAEVLQWRAETALEDVIDRLVESELRRANV
jgi:GDPmannose 4,6-dehydratase